MTEPGGAGEAESPSLEGDFAHGGALPPGVLVARVGAGANCSSAGSAIDILFYTSVIAGAIAVALAAAFPPRSAEASGPPGGAPGDDAPGGEKGAPGEAR